MMLVLAGVLIVVLLVGWKIAHLTSKQVLTLLIAVVTAIVLLVILFHFSTQPPKENKVIANFYAHRASYEQIRGMLLEDEDLDYVAPWGIHRPGSVNSTVPPDGDASGRRFREYLALFKQIGAKEAIHTNDRGVEILVWRSGFAADTRHVAIAWLEREPKNMVGSLDEFYNTPKPREPVYRHIVDNWYIWADW